MSDGQGGLLADEFDPSRPFWEPAVKSSEAELQSFVEEGEYEELRTFLSKADMTKWYETLIMNEVSFDALLEMSESDLQELGLAKGPRIKMMRTAEKFRASNAASTTNASSATTKREPPDEFLCPISHVSIGTQATCRLRVWLAARGSCSDRLLVLTGADARASDGL